MRLSKTRSSLFGYALGARTEFIPFDEIVSRWPPLGPSSLAQMTISVGKAILETSAVEAAQPTAWASCLRRAFVEWLESPEKNRAPGTESRGHFSSRLKLNVLGLRKLRKSRYAAIKKAVVGRRRRPAAPRPRIPGGAFFATPILSK